MFPENSQHNSASRGMFLECTDQIPVADDMGPVQWAIVADGSSCVGELCKGELGKLGGPL